MDHVLALFWNRADQRACARAAFLSRAIAADACAWTEAFAAPGLSVWNQKGRVLAVPRGGGCVIGNVFARPDGARRGAPVRAQPNDAAVFAASRGARLCNAWWGDYLAFLFDPAAGRLDIVRDPSGARQCFVAADERAGQGAGQGAGKSASQSPRQGVAVIFSHAEDVRRLGALAVCVDWDAVLWFLLRSRLQTRRTALSGVEEIQPGERVTLEAGRASRVALWDPASFCARPDGRDFDALAQSLRCAIETCADAWAHGAGADGGAILHRLSGGLDSTIALLALAGARQSDTPNWSASEKGASEHVAGPLSARAGITCVTYYDEDAPQTDERAMARRAAARAGCPLVEMAMAARDIDYARALDADLQARPSTALLSFADPRPAALARAHGASLVTSGSGGDNLFYRVRHALGAADALRAAPLGAAAREAIVAGARLSGRSVWESAAEAVLYGLLRAPWPQAHLFPINPHFVRADACRSAPATALTHAWVREAGDLPPGKMAHLWLLADALHYRAPSVSSLVCEYRPVLLSQPIMEACLSVPSNLLIEKGRDRALARAAFATDLPREIALRDAKGLTNSYFADVVAANAPFLRDVLLGGELVRCGMLDRAALERALSPAALATGSAPAGLIVCLSAELWLAHARARLV